jgi:hypothetical protein
MAWHPLAYIPCEHYYSQKQYNEFDTNTNHYWMIQLYEAGFASFIAQQAGAMDDVYLQLGNKGKYVNLCIPLDGNYTRLGGNPQSASMSLMESHF